MVTIERIKYIERLGNLITLLVALAIVISASIVQIILHELPCPLCLLQRVGFLYIAFGFLLNFRFGFRPSHYAVILLSGLFTSFVALRQIALHIIPGTGFYGSAILGFHLYTWSFIFAMCIVIVTIILLSVDKQYLNINESPLTWRKWTNLLYVLFVAILLVNIVSVILECGIKDCPDNPIKYELLSISTIM